MTVWTAAWLLWIFAFAVIEGAALFVRTGNATLSSHVWAWFSIKNKSPGYRWRRLFLVTFLAWLVTHFLTGGWM